MKRAWGHFVPSLVFLSWAVACSNSDGGSPIGVSGAPGSAGTGNAGAGGAVGSAGSAGAGVAGASAGSSGSSAGSAGASAGSGGAGAGSGGASGGSTGSGCTGVGTICWDFEEGALPTGWSNYRSEFPDGQLLVDNTKAHAGTMALHAKGLKGGTQGQDGGPKRTIRFTLPANFGPVLWGRAWVYSTIAPQSHMGVFNARYPKPNTTDTDITKLDWYEAAIYTGKYMTVWHPPEPPGFPEWVKVSGTDGIVNQWACWEWQFDGKNGDMPQAADPRLWINGTELTWPMEFTFSVPATTVRPTQDKVTNFTVLETGMYMYQYQPEAADLWIDQLAVGKERIGCQ